MTSLLKRFEDDDVVIRELNDQKIIRGEPQVAERLVRHPETEVIEFAAGSHLIHEQDQDSDCYFILAGKVDLVVGGDSLGYTRGAGEVVGEFAAINPKLRRTASVVAIDDVVALRCTSRALSSVQNAEIWRRLAVELTHKVEQRNALLAKVNERPRVFIIATESLSDAGDHLRQALGAKFEVETWNPRELVAPGVPELDALRKEAQSADFAVVLADPHDLEQDDAKRTPEHSVRFELGFVIAELSPDRTVLIMPCQTKEATPKLFKGLQPMTFCIEDDEAPLGVILADIMRKIEEIVSAKSVRTRFGADRRK